MSDHHTSYTINAMIGQLYLQNVAFRLLDFAEQQSIVLDLLAGSYRSDVNIAEMLSNECFVSHKDSRETRTLSTIFNICSYCRQAKDDVEDYGEPFNVQGFCPECASENFSDEELEQRRAAAQFTVEK